LAPGKNRKKNENLIETTLCFFSLPIFIAAIFLIYVFLVRKNIDIRIPEILNFNNNEINIKKLYFLNYGSHEAVQFLKFYDFLVSLIFIFAIPYFLIVSSVMFGNTPRIIQSYLYIVRSKYSNLVRLILATILFYFGFLFIGIYFMQYLMGFELNFIRSGQIELFIFIRILMCSFYLLGIFVCFIFFYKYILLRYRLYWRKNAKVV
jgi:hypothetical protein